MSFLLPSGSNQHEPLPSLPTTPTLQMDEEDLGNASWLDAHEEHHHTESLMPHSTRKNKGKGKAREIDVGQEVDEEEESIGSGSSVLNPVAEETADGVLGYPPTSSEEEESKRVAENLKRMEAAERLRRKAARESTSSLGSSSIVGDVSRRASLLWRQGRRSSRATNGGGSGNHQRLSMRSSEDTMPLDAMDRSPRTASSETAFSPIRRSLSPADNPFDPPDTATPLNTKSSGAVMTPSSPPDTSKLADSPFADSASVPSKPTLQATTSFTLEPPPIPMPLGLPPPKTPPPRVPSPGEVHMDGQEDLNPSRKEHRWWTDWLCGCREADDQGDDGQAGRTNPFE